MANSVSGANMFSAGMYVTGSGIASGTTITSVTINFISGAVTINLSSAVTAAIPAATTLQFSSMANACSTITKEIRANDKD